MSSENTETMTTTIEVDKDLFLKFKALCVLNETTISKEVERLIKERVAELSKNMNLG
jgi:hypothetical protein